MIKKTKTGYEVLSESGKKMGSYLDEESAERRLKQIEYFKSMKECKFGVK